MVIAIRILDSVLNGDTMDSSLKGLSNSKPLETQSHSVLIEPRWLFPGSAGHSQARYG